MAAKLASPWWTWLTCCQASFLQPPSCKGKHGPGAQEATGWRCARLFQEGLVLVALSWHWSRYWGHLHCMGHPAPLQIVSQS
jgi:hypothetical protein